MKSNFVPFSVQFNSGWPYKNSHFSEAMKCERVIKKPQKDEKLAKIFPVYSIFILDNNEIILSSVLLKERSQVIRAASLINKNVLRATQLS